MATEPQASADEPAQPAAIETPAADGTQEPSIRWWPAVAIAVLMWAVIKYTASGPRTATMVHFIGSMAAPGNALLLMGGWWLFASRAPKSEKRLGFLLTAVLAVAAIVISHPSVSVQPWVAMILPWTITALAAAFFLASRIGWRHGRWLPLAVVQAALLFGACIRVDGINGDFVADLSPRWTPTDEEVFLSETKAVEAPAALELPMEPGPNDWPEFRGSDRDSRVAGVAFATDWEASPPKELWRRKIGPGWSSFTVVTGTLFTQEQRGDEEVVSAYEAGTGEPLWTNAVPSRFYETVGGAGPRATPTYHQGVLYTQGAAGKVQAIDAATGESLWVRDLTEDTPAEPPAWGFSSSPLVWGDLVIAYAGAGNGLSVIAYQKESGEIAWTSGDSTHSYSSPQRATIAGVEQLLVLSNSGLASFNHATGTQLWHHPWDIGEMPRVVQPTVFGDSVLLGTGYGLGTQRIEVTNTDGEWATEEAWTSNRLKPYFNDYVHASGYLYGFDGPVFTCVNAEDGKREWKRGRYGHGQVLLLDDMGVLLVIGEAGELVLLEATPKKHTEICQIQALEGKTWNHPVVADSKLFLRNGEEAVCYDLGGAPATQVAGP
ncbi:MAG: PQQ-binding-like beta-propeller repeat protein [Planctomycetota bacterium]